MGILIDRAILDHRFRTGVDLQQLVETAVEKKYLQVKAPAGHILIKIIQVGIMIDVFELRDPPVMLAQHLRQRRLTGADIACNRYVLGFFVLYHVVIFIMRAPKTSIRAEKVLRYYFFFKFGLYGQKKLCTTSQWRLSLPRHPAVPIRAA